jgi:hypothetical protein
MDRDIVQCTITGLAGLVLGSSLGRKVQGEATALLKVIETRLASIEGLCADVSVRQAGTTNAYATAVEKHAAAIVKLAGAIVTHAAAVDDHGAATVAAAVEHQAAILASSAVSGIRQGE